MTDKAQKVYPFDETTEKATLASMIFDEKALDLGLTKLTEESYYLSVHKSVFKAIKNLYDIGSEVELISLAEYLNKLEFKEPEVFLSELMESVMTASNISYWCNVLIELQKKRQLLDMLAMSQAMIFTDSAMEAISKIESQIQKIEGGNTQDEFVSIADVVPSIFNDIEKRIVKNNDLIIPTGFDDLDCDLAGGGLRGGQLVYVGAGTSAGKTSFAMTIVFNNPSKRVALFSFEMTRSELAEKFMTMHSGVSSDRILSNKISRHELNTLSLSAGDVSNLKIWMYDRGVNIDTLRLKLKGAIKKYGIQYAVIDYIGLIKKDPKKNTFDNYSEFSSKLKLMAVEFDIPIIAISQFSRDSQKREKDANKKRPILADLKNCGDLENDANIVWLLHEINPDGRMVNSVRDIELIMAKQRAGKLGIYSLQFDTQRTMFLKTTNNARF